MVVLRVRVVDQVGTALASHTLTLTPLHYHPTSPSSLTTPSRLHSYFNTSVFVMVVYLFSTWFGGLWSGCWLLVRSAAVSIFLLYLLDELLQFLKAEVGKRAIAE